MAPRTRASTGPEIFTGFGLPKLETRPHHSRRSGPQSGAQNPVDFAFLAIVVAIYAVTHGLIWAVARLAGGQK